MRRIFSPIPDTIYAHRVVAELQAAGIERSEIHASARDGIDLTGLPVATALQRQDRTWFLEHLFWNGNLILFGLAAVGLALALSGGWALGAAALAVMVGSLAMGNWFSVKVPHTHIGDLRVPLEHGEVVLMVDVPRKRVREIEQLVSRHHPETDVGGVGWTVPALGT